MRGLRRDNVNAILYVRGGGEKIDEIINSSRYIYIYMFLYTENLRRKNIVERTRRRGVKKSNVFFDFACFFFFFFSFLSIPVFNSIEEFLMNLYIYVYI